MNHDELVAAYTAPGRHYHNLKHIEDCLGALAGVAAHRAAGFLVPAAGVREGRSTM
jgi:predicted metal-dependent HD superfamily phosphohydrolase